MWDTRPRSDIFPRSRMMTPEVLMVEADHDMRNPADLLVLDKLAKGIFARSGHRHACRPLPGPRERRSSTRRFRFMLSMQNAGQLHNYAVPEGPHGRHAQAGRRAGDNDQHDAAHVWPDATAHRHDSPAWSAKRRRCRPITDELRDHIADFEDFWRPIRSYFYWEKHCYDIPDLLFAEVRLRCDRRC